jgi:hypothetical protein
VRDTDKLVGISFSYQTEFDTGTIEKVSTFFAESKLGEGTTLYDSLAEVSQYAERLHMPVGSIVLILFSDGVDNMSQLKAEKVITQLQLDGVSCFPMFLNGRNSSERGLAFLKRLADDTGGVLLTFNDQGSAGEVLKRWQPVLRRRLLASYQPAKAGLPASNTTKLQAHQIKIRSKRDNLLFFYPKQRIEESRK